MSPETRAACAGKWMLFDSTQPELADRAVAICHTCPLLEACREHTEAERRRTRRAGQAISGTWAGRLYGASRDPIGDQFPEDELRTAHARYQQGVRTPTVTYLERVYQRNRKRQQKRTKEDAA